MSDQEHFRKMEYHEIMWAEQSPDIYAGPNCDDVKPGWKCFAEGDKGQEMGLAELELSAQHFHPGTKVIVMEPMCPECQQIASMCRYDKYCDFDWDFWVDCEYS